MSESRARQAIRRPAARSRTDRAPARRSTAPPLRVAGLSNQGIQAKLTVGRQDDPLEREADRAAERVLAGESVGALGSTAPEAQRECATCEAEEKDTVRRQPLEEEEELLQPKSEGAETIRRQPLEEEEELLQPKAEGAETLRRQPLEEEEELLQPKSGAGGTQGLGAEAAASAVGSGGRPLSGAERGYFEPRFGHDFSSVRIHDGPSAQSAAAAINARAYTLRNGIAFAAGAYAPATAQGRRLLAHELAHTIQQGAAQQGAAQQGAAQQHAAGTIRRTCPSDPSQIPPGGEKEFEAEVGKVKAHDAYTGLKPLPDEEHPRDIADHIIDGARGSACPMFYIKRLKVLFDTPRNPKKKTAGEMRERAETAVAAETIRLSDPGWAELVGVEEAVTAAHKGSMRRERGLMGKDFWIDDRNPAKIRIKMKVFPRPRGTGTKDDVDRTIALEDAIETRTLQNGYLLDIDFVKKSGGDVFNVGVDPSQWVTAGNWVGDDQGLAHEAHHLLNLEDRYNYLVHAENKNMDIPNRLYWFREQMVRPADPLAPGSIMGPKDEAGGRSDKLNEEDICAIVRGDYRNCLVTRFGLLSTTRIEEKANELSHPYRPQHAALLRAMSDAWDTRPFDEKTKGCAEGDPLCGMAPERSFGDPNVTGTDQTKFPLRNPHRQREGESLARKARVVP